eukprot:gnl/TRDRNA2_/TRDRNA2_120472_c0_seq2.p1 gnl/TRDRNA2_/TRDRNA2_120472_c0~~gnl/TRDRNA2_/TRDRNA2_120472_c0_seq2.p1  ORF type:complete len:302 (+),score=44.00 gnl/TRDRNA2_/TRDRNA2_120472_c0_seq2:35-940(+)
MVAAAVAPRHPSEFLLLRVWHDYGRRALWTTESERKDVVAALQRLFEAQGFRYPKFEPLGLDTPLCQVAGGLLVISQLPCCPVQWPHDLFDGAGLVPMWRWDNVEDAKARMDEHILSGQHLVTSKGHMTGVALDGSFHFAPPSWRGSDMQAWLLSCICGRWASQVRERLGLVVVDFVLTELCAEVVRRNLAQAGRQCSTTCEKEESCCSSSQMDAGSCAGICHFGVSRCERTKRAVISTQHDLPADCAIIATAYANKHSDVYECSAVRRGPRHFELTVSRTDVEDGGWGQDLFVAWEARAP